MNLLTKLEVEADTQAQIGNGDFVTAVTFLIGTTVIDETTD